MKRDLISNKTCPVKNCLRFGFHCSHCNFIQNFFFVFNLKHLYFKCLNEVARLTRVFSYTHSHFVLVENECNQYVPHMPNLFLLLNNDVAVFLRCFAPNVAKLAAFENPARTRSRFVLGIVLHMS